MSAPSIMSIAIVAFCAVVYLHTPSWRPVALALGGALSIDIYSDVTKLAGREALACWLSAPALAAWCAWHVLGRDEERAALVGMSWGAAMLAALWAPWPWLWWGAAPLVARLVSLWSQLAAARAWLRRDRVGPTVELAALALLAGDVLSLLGPAGLIPGISWGIATIQGGIVAAGVAALWITRGGIRSGE